MSEYNQRVLQILRNRGHDDSKIAEMLGASRVTVNQVINGKRSGRNIAQKIRKLAEASNFTAEEWRAVGIGIGNTIIRIPATSTKTPLEPISPIEKIKEGTKEAIRSIPRMAEYAALEYEEQRKERNRTARAKPRQQEPPLPKASKVKPGDIVEVDTRTGRPKRKPRNSKSRRQIAQYQAFTEMVRQSMGAEPPQTDTSEELDTEEQGQLVTIKTLPDGRLSVGIKQDAQWCIYCGRPATLQIPCIGPTCPYCSRNYITDPRVYR